MRTATIRSMVGLLLLLVLSQIAQAARFVRGDVDGSKEIDISDSIQILGHLFLGEPKVLSCEDAADVDDSNALDLSDAIDLLTYTFLGGLPPRQPFPSCGLDPTDDLLSCDSFEPCTSAPCGGFIGLPCEKGEVCDIIPGACNGADFPGECVSVPAECPKILQEVCGCDGVTYANDCERLKAGMQKSHDGPCAGGKICGGFIGLPCDKGFFCEFPDGTCGNADLQGECVEITRICPLVFIPVCGCDGLTYSNDCARRGAGVSKMHDGSCEGANR